MAGADLKTTAEERERMQRYAGWITAHAGHSATELRAVARAVPLILSDLDTLLAENAVLRKQAWDDAGGERAEWCGRVLALEAENAKLRAVAEAAKFVCSRRRGSMLPQAIDDLDEALAALEAP